MTAALAVCLASQPDSVLESLLPSPEASRETVACLVGGDVSGVQDFIYTVTPRGAASSLRGRSLYLQLLTEASARYLLHALGLPPTNLVYASGGRFFLLAPPGEDTRLALETARQYIARVLLRHHAGDLYVALAHVPLAPEILARGRLGQAWEELTQRLRTAKERRFSELGGDLQRLLFLPWRDEGNEAAECQVCHHEHPDTRVMDGVRKCPPCLAYEDLGDALRRARYVVWDEVEPAFTGDEGSAGRPDDVLRALGADVRLAVDVPPPTARARRVLALSDAAFSALAAGPRVAVGRMYLVNVTPEREGRVASNDELAEASCGIDRLGVLRMDVDDLGRILNTGLGDLASISRMATLSAAIRRFFEGWVASRAAQYNPPGGVQRVYSIYSGGDDLFFVGAWDALAELALQIRNDFVRYACGHPALHISGGLVLVTPHYPLYQAAQEAGAAEDDAKARPGKDAFSFLGRVLPWSDVVRAHDLASRLKGQRRAGQARAALLRLLMRTQEAHEAAARRRALAGTDRTASGAPQAYYGPWIPRAEYNLARLAERQRPEREEILALRTLLREDDFQAIGWIGTAARWAELLTRTRGSRREGA